MHIPFWYLNFNIKKKTTSVWNIIIYCRQFHWKVVIDSSRLLRIASFNIKMRPHIAKSIHWTLYNVHAHCEPWIIKVFYLHCTITREAQEQQMFSWTFSNPTNNLWIEIYRTLITWSVACLRCWNKQFFILQHQMNIFSNQASQTATLFRETIFPHSNRIKLLHWNEKLDEELTIPILLVEGNKMMGWSDSSLLKCQMNVSHKLTQLKTNHFPNCFHLPWKIIIQTDINSKSNKKKVARFFP